MLCYGDMRRLKFYVPLFDGGTIICRHRNSG